MAVEAIKMAVRGNMHMDTRVIKVAGFKSEFNLDLWGCLEDAKASGTTKIRI